MSAILLSWTCRLAGTAVSRKAGASMLSQLMVVKKTFPTANAWIASSRESIQMLLKHSLVNISENPVLVLLEATGRDTPIQKNLVLLEGIRRRRTTLQRKLRMKIGSKAEYGGSNLC